MPDEVARRRGAHTQEEGAALVKYSLGIVLGVVVVRRVRGLLCCIPGVGAVLGPVTALMPITLLGAAAGAAAVYSIEEGDARAVQHKLLPKARQGLQRAHKEVRATVASLQTQLRDLKRRHDAAVRKLERAGEQAADTVQKGLRQASPTIERELAALERDYQRQRQRLETALWREQGRG